jgi:hypothetical protein
MTLGAATAAQAQRPDAPSARWDAHVASLIEAYYTAWPSAAVNAGRHEYDGRLPRLLAAGLAALDTPVHELAVADRGVRHDRTSTPIAGFERNYVLAMLDRQLWSLKSIDAPHRSPAFYSGALDPDVYLTRPYAPLRQRMQAYIRYARAVARAAPQIQGNLRTPLARTMIDRGRGAFGGFASFYRDNVPAVFAAVQDSALQRELAPGDTTVPPRRCGRSTHGSRRNGAPRRRTLPSARIDSARCSTRASASTRRSRSSSGSDGQTSRATRPRYGRHARGMHRARAFPSACGRPIAHKPPENTLDAARRQLKMLRSSSPSTESCRSPAPRRRSSVNRRRTMRYKHRLHPDSRTVRSRAAVHVLRRAAGSVVDAGAAGGIHPSESNLLFISAHECGLATSSIPPCEARASLFGCSFGNRRFSEAGPTNAEEMMWDEGLGGGDPETHIGQLTNALLRDVRFLSAIGLHTRGMTVVVESERLFREEAFQGEAVARQQAARGTFDPGI